MERFGVPIYQVGILAAMSAFSFAGALAWSMLADRVQRPRAVLLICAVLYCGLMTCLLANPFSGSSGEVLGLLYLALVFGAAQFCLAGCYPLVDALVLALLTRDLSATKALFGRQRLWGSIGHALATVLSAWSIDAMVRWFGYREGSQEAYRGPFVLLIVTTAIFVAVVVFAFGPEDDGLDMHLLETSPMLSSVEEADLIIDEPMIGLASPELGPKDSPEPESQQQREAVVKAADIWTLVPRNAEFTFLLLVVAVAGYGRTVMSNFQSVFVTEWIGLDRSFMSWAAQVRLLTEVAVFFHGNTLMEFIGPHWMLLLGQFAGALRTLGYSFMPSSSADRGKSRVQGGRKLSAVGLGFLLFLELFKGLNSGLLVLGGVRLANDLAPRALANTAQGLFSGFYTGLGGLCGGVIAGILIRWCALKNPETGRPLGRGESGLPGMFWWSSLVLFLTSIVFGMKFALWDRVIFVRHRQSRREDEESRAMICEHGSYTQPDTLDTDAIIEK